MYVIGLTEMITKEKKMSWKYTKIICIRNRTTRTYTHLIGSCFYMKLLTIVNQQFCYCRWLKTITNKEWQGFTKFKLFYLLNVLAENQICSLVMIIRRHFVLSQNGKQTHTLVYKIIDICNTKEVVCI